MQRGLEPQGRLRAALICVLLLVAVLPAAGGEPTGKILCEYFTDVGGSDITGLFEHEAFPAKPDKIETLDKFELPRPNLIDNYGSLIRGFVHPPANGNYTFWIASDDNSALYISPSENPDQKQLIASVNGFTGEKAWDSQPNQKSKPIALIAGKKYYIESVQKEGSGGDHLAVGWQLPDGKMERPIPGARLSPATFPAKSIPQGQIKITVTHPKPLPNTWGHHKFQKVARIEGPGYTHEMSYCLYLPKDYDKTNDLKPVIMFLHGNTHQGYDLGGILNEGPPEMLESNKKLREYFPFIGVWPQCPPGMRWDQKVMIKASVAILDEVMKEFRADKDRVYCTGLSMGGQGTWRVAFEAADRFAAISPISAIEINPGKAAEAFKNLHIWIICGANDGGFTDGSRKMFAALKEGGVDAHLTVFPNEGHGVWGRYYPDPKFYEWLLKYKRSHAEPVPVQAAAAPAPNAQPAPKAEQPAPAAPKAGAAILPPPTAPAGSIYCEYFKNVDTTNVEDVLNGKSLAQPTQSEALPLFEIPTDADDAYVTRVRGYVYPPESGDYTFWIASDDQSALFISSSENPADKTRIAFVGGWTPPRAWDQAKEQQSAPIKLTAGKKYFIETVHIEGSGGDNLSVGWKLPNGTMERPIPGNRLAPAGKAKPIVTEVKLDDSKPLPQAPGHHKLKAQASGSGYNFELPYLLYLPKDYEKSNDLKPVVIFLHGAGEGGTDLEMIYVHGPNSALKNDPKFRDYANFIVLSPQCIPGRRWDSRGSAAAVVGLLDELTKKYRIDADRVYVTGLSMGGRGTWIVGMEAPDRFAALAPISAVAHQPETAGARLKDLSVWIIVGSDDGGFTDGSRQMAEVLRKAGADTSLTVVPGAGHGPWGNYYPDPKFYDWLLKHKRKKPPPPPVAVVTQPAAVAPAPDTKIKTKPAPDVKVAVVPPAAPAQTSPRPETPQAALSNTPAATVLTDAAGDPPYAPITLSLAVVFFALGVFFLVTKPREPIVVQSAGGPEPADLSPPGTRTASARAVPVINNSSKHTSGNLRRKL